MTNELNSDSIEMGRFETEITKEQLAPCVKKLHKVTERICEEKIESLV